MSFLFRNMQTFIRNCLEPHLVSLNRVMQSADLKLKKDVDFEIEELKKQLKAYQDFIDNRFNNLNQAVEDRLDSFSAIPVGIVIVWTSTVNPADAEKWFDCDGSRYDQSRYPDLFKILRSTSLPDYRGYFLRGVGGNSGSLGQAQGDAIRNFTGQVNGGVAEEGSRYNGVFYSTGLFQNGGGPPHQDWGIGLDASRQVPTAGENRPINKSVRYLIRVLA